MTPAYKWLRAVGDQEFTGAHMDRVFVGGAARMLTAWIPLGDVPVEQGSLLVCCSLTSACVRQEHLPPTPLQMAGQERSAPMNSALDSAVLDRNSHMAGKQQLSFTIPILPLMHASMD